MPSTYNPAAAQYRRPSITAFNRLLPIPVSIDFEKNLRAAVHDPLWFLARQWQMGEFLGEDAGAPAFVRVESSTTEPSTLILGPANAPGAKPYNYRDQPLEPVIEREAVLISVHQRIQAGYYFQKLLRVRKLESFIPLFVENFPLPIANLPAWDGDALELLVNTRGRVADGVLIMQDLATESRLENWVRSKPAMAPAAAAILAAAADLAKWFRRTYPTTATALAEVKPKAWKTEQLEYSLAFEMTDRATGQTSRIVGEEYADGQLDWPDFNWAGAMELPNAVKTAESFIPTAVRYQGMPSPRYWEMEEGRVNFGKISMSPSNVLSVAFAEFGLAYSNDWFWVPMNLKINSVCRIDKLEVTNVFGDRFAYPLTLANTTDPLAKFNLFSFFTDSGQAFPALYLPPTLTKVQEGEPMERVHFMRDELSNLAWAVETIVPSVMQRGIEVKTVAPPAAEPTDANALVYKLGNLVPENWTPFIPVRISSQQHTRLQRARMPESKLPKGVVLQDKPIGTPYFIREEEVHRAGIVVERNWQRVRWLNGKTFCWVGRRKTTGRFDTGHGLRWDYVVRE